MIRSPRKASITEIWRVGIKDSFDVRSTLLHTLEYLNNSNTLHTFVSSNNDIVRLENLRNS